MSGDAKMDDASAVMSKHDKDEQDFEPARVYREEVYRSQLGTRDCGGTFATFGMAVFEAEPCIWLQSLVKS
jgi:hypothetical protein